MVFQKNTGDGKLTTAEEMEIRSFLWESGLEESVRIEALPAEASPRRYFRLTKEGGETRILCYRPDPPEESADDFITINKKMAAAGVPVPEIFARNRSGTLLLLTDGGRSDLSSELRRSLLTGNIGVLESYLEEALRVLERIHRIEPFHPVDRRAFDREKLDWELSFLRERVGNLRAEERSVFLPPPRFWEELGELCRILGAEGPRVFTHRDYHGRNIMVRRSASVGCRLTVLDYQDARMGLPCYDLCSLLLDPYTELPREHLEWGFAVYGRESSRDVDANRKLFFRQGLQRLLKALGTYIHLGFEKKFRAYLDPISPALERIEWLAEEGTLSVSAANDMRRMGDSLLIAVEHQRERK